MNSQEAVLATLAYSDIFDYPLKFSEIQQNLIFAKSSEKRLKQNLEKLVRVGKILTVGQFYQLKRSDRLVKKRLAREKYADRKMRRAKFAAKILSIIPTVKLVGVSGALAVGNTPKDDDIDFFIVCSKGYLWTSRFFCNLFLDFLGLRRKPEDYKVSNKICLNMFLTEDSLKLVPADLYLAHEILQLKPIFERDGTYKKFIQENSWTFEFLPNWPTVTYFASWSLLPQTKSVLAGKPIFNFLEFFLRNFQLKLMSRRRTTEIISDNKLFFHPGDVHQKVLAEFEKRLRRLKIPLDPSTSSGLRL